MTGAGAAQNKLGELFVDIGVGGLGKTLKALNSVSATFLLTKNAAVQLGKPLIDVGKKTLNMAVDVGKLGSTLGIAYKDAYKLQYYFKHMNLNEGLVGDIEKMSELFSLISVGQGELTKTQATGFQRLGLNWLDYWGGGFEKAQQMIKDIQKATAGMDRTEAVTALQQIGMSREWLYAFDRGVYDISDALAISNEEIEAAIAASESLNEANLALKRALEEATITLAPFVTQYAPQLAKTIVDWTPKLVNALETIAKWCDKSFTSIGDTVDKVKSHPVLGNKENLKKSAIATGLGHLTFGPVGGFLAGATAFNALDSGNNLVKQVPDMVKSGKFLLPNASIPYRILDSKINITNHITGSNADEIAKKVSSSDSKIIQDMYNKYQVSNTVGK